MAATAPHHKFAPAPSATATATGGGAAGAATATAEYLFTPGTPFGVLENSFKAKVSSEPGIPAGTTIAAVGPGTVELSSPATASGPQVLSAGAQPFAVGQPISGASDTGIPSGATITAVSGQTL